MKENKGIQVDGLSTGTKVVITGHNNEGIIFLWMLARLNNGGEAGS